MRSEQRRREIFSASVRAGGATGASGRSAAGHRRSAALHPHHAALGQADVGAHDQLRAARLGDRQGARLSLSGDASRRRASPGRRSRACCSISGRRSRATPPPPEACLVNYYAGAAKMGLHQDKDEEDFAAPVLSVSLGDTGIFRVGGRSRKDPTREIRAQVGRCGGAGRRGPARLSRHRPHPARHVGPACRGRALQSHAAARDEAEVSCANPRALSRSRRPGNRRWRPCAALVPLPLRLGAPWRRLWPRRPERA